MTFLVGLDKGVIGLDQRRIARLKRKLCMVGTELESQSDHV